MSVLDDAALQHMAYLVLSENRPFSFKDFLLFPVDGKEYRMKPGTFRNKILELKKKGIVELNYNSGIAFYTLKSHRFGKPVTPNHTVAHNDSVYDMLQNLPLDKQSIHDIRLTFKVPNIWKIFSFNRNLPINKRSKDIIIPSWSKDNAIVRTMIHKTDTVSVIIGCSLVPIPLDANGIIRFFNMLVRVEEKLQTILDSSIPINCTEKSCSIPEYETWIVTMWHFGRDASIEYAGAKFTVTIEKLKHILTRIYVKDFNGKKKIRIETQEYPKKTVLDAIEEKLGNIIDV
jgi:hypothetical protein